MDADDWPRYHPRMEYEGHIITVEACAVETDGPELSVGYFVRISEVGKNVDAETVFIREKSGPVMVFRSSKDAMAFGHVWVDQRIARRNRPSD